MKKRRWTKDDTHFTFLAFLPTVHYLLFCYLPMFGIIIAFKNYRISGGFLQSLLNSSWVGLQNFKFMFTNKDVWRILRNTLAYNGVMICVGFFLTVSLAILVNELHNKKLAKLYQTLMFFPYFLSWIVVASVVWAFLSYDMGMVNGILEFFGADRHRWYMEPKFWPGFLVFMSQWKGLGCGMVVYLACIAALDKTVYEAAIIDGASKWQQIWRITLPMMRTIIVLQFIMATGHIFYSDFGLFFSVPRDSGSLYNTVTTLDVFVYKQLRGSTIGMASASAMFQSVTACIMTLFVNWIVKKIDDDLAMI